MVYTAQTEHVYDGEVHMQVRTVPRDYLHRVLAQRSRQELMAGKMADQNVELVGPGYPKEAGQF